MYNVIVRMREYITLNTNELGDYTKRTYPPYVVLNYSSNNKSLEAVKYIESQGIKPTLIYRPTIHLTGTEIINLGNMDEQTEAICVDNKAIAISSLTNMLEVCIQSYCENSELELVIDRVGNDSPCSVTERVGEEATKEFVEYLMDRIKEVIV